MKRAFFCTDFLRLWERMENISKGPSLIADFPFPASFPQTPSTIAAYNEGCIQKREFLDL